MLTVAVPGSFLDAARLLGRGRLTLARLWGDNPVEPSDFPLQRKRKNEFMEYLIGVGLAVVVCTFAMLAGFDRDRVFYPTLLTVIATYYILFAVMGSSTPALAIESAVAGAFV